LVDGGYILNNNPDAHFEMDDDELCIPVVGGSFVTFNGLRPHQLSLLLVL
jgi:hypothetical protein